MAAVLIVRGRWRDDTRELLSCIFANLMEVKEVYRGQTIA